MRERGAVRGLDVDVEVEYVKKWEESRGNEVRVITPFYYPVFLQEVGDASLFIINPFGRDTYRVEYRIPNVIALKGLMDNYSLLSRDFLSILRRVRELLHEYSSPRNWIPRGVVLEKIVYDKELLRDLGVFIDNAGLNSVKGVVLKTSGVEDLASINLRAIDSCLKDLTNVVLELNSLWNKIIEYRSRWAQFIKTKREAEVLNISRSYEIVKEIVNDRSMYLSRRLDQELRVVNSRYESRMNELRYKLSSIDREIEKLKKKMKHARNGEEKKQYRIQLKNMYNRRKEVVEEIRNIRSNWRREPENVKKKYLKLLNIENNRMKFYEDERKRLLKEYEKLMRRIDNMLEDISTYISRISDLVNNYRSRITRLFVNKTSFVDGLVYLRGYVVLGKQNNVYIASYLSIHGDKPVIKPVKSIKYKLLGREVLKKLVRTDPRLLYKYNYV